MMDNTSDDTDFCPVNETEICREQEVEITLDIEKNEVSPTMNEITNERAMLPETIAYEGSVSSENYGNKNHGYTKHTNPVVKDRHFEVSSTSSINDTEKIVVNKPQENRKTQPTSNYTFEQIENELQCAICTELLIKVTTLNCSHSFCKDCIKEWRKTNKNCPICRTKIGTANRTSVLDNFIGKILKSAPKDIRQHRNEVVKAREKNREGGGLCNSYVLEDLKVLRTHCYFDENCGSWCVTIRAPMGS
ncbi:hypothetical protein Trydic_g23561 [Trypoxylus dichotomus]